MRNGWRLFLYPGDVYKRQDLPCAHFRLACCEEGGQAEGVVADACQLVETGFLKTGVGEHFARVVLVEFCLLYTSVDGGTARAVRVRFARDEHAQDDVA